MMPVVRAAPLRSMLRDWLSKSISNRITFAALSVAVTVALVIGVVSYCVVAVLVSRSIHSELNSQARLTLQRLQGDLNAFSADMATVASNSFIANGLVDSLGRDTYLLPFLHEHKPLLPIRTSFLLCDFKGRVIASNGEAGPMPATMTVGIQHVLATALPQATLMTINGKIHLVLMQPVIFPPTGQAEGALVGVVPLKELFDAETRHIGEEYLVRLTSGATTVSREVGGGAEEGTIGVHYPLQLTEPLKDVNLTFHIGLPRSTAHRPLTFLTVTYLLFMTAILMLVLKFAQAMARRLTLPLISLSETAERIARSGSIDLITEVTGMDEVGTLGSIFNEMLKKLRASHEELESQVEKRTRELKDAHDLLEIRVRRRTAQLSEANLQLEQEIEMKLQLEQQLRQVQKMEAIGTLAGGIAHDFNNILTVIGAYGTLTSMAMADSDPLKTNVDHIVTATEKAANLTRSLLAFSRKQVMKSEDRDLNDIVRNLEKFLLRVIGEDIQLRTVFREPFVPVHVDPGQIDQVLMNFAANARDAMPRGGMLTIETGVQVLDSEYLRCHGYEHPAGRYALLTVSDSGCGMDRETTRKIFEPFFTTKEVGRGTGLGLSMVYGIIKQHNGHITVYSEPMVGTSFRIYLPTLTEGVSEGDRPQSPAICRAGGNEKILVAEDDADIRQVVAKILEEAGYGIVVAVDGQDAVEKFAEGIDEFSLVLLDVIMPRKSGKEACNEISQARPGIKVLFTSGYAADFIKSRGDLQEGADLVMKPVHPVELLRKVREMLDS